MSSASGTLDIYSWCMKEDAKGSQQEQPVLEGEILPPLRPEPETAQAAKEAAEPVISQYFLTQIKEAAPAEPDAALTFLALIGFRGGRMPHPTKPPTRA